MASNRELAAQAAELADALGREVKTHGLNHSALDRLVAELRAELAALAPESNELPTIADEPADTMPATPSAKHAAEGAAVADPASAPPAVPSSEPSYAVARGHSFKTLRGRMTPGAVVTARDFVHGQQAIDHLVSIGAVLKS